MNQHRLVSALRRYLAHRSQAVNVVAVEAARREVLSTIPQKGKWFFCEVDGQDYAVRVSMTYRIEIMHNIFNNEFNTVSHPQPSAHA